MFSPRKYGNVYISADKHSFPLKNIPKKYTSTS